MYDFKTENVDQVWNTGSHYLDLNVISHIWKQTDSEYPYASSVTKINIWIETYLRQLNQSTRPAMSSLRWRLQIAAACFRE